MKAVHNTRHRVGGVVSVTMPRKLHNCLDYTRVANNRKRQLGVNFVGLDAIHAYYGRH